MLPLDGQTLEGGGQLVRIALALSTITKTPINITKIRQNRTGKKGLKASHLAAIHFLSTLSGSTISGAEVGSSTLTFIPPRKPPALLEEYYRIELDTPGSAFLVFQSVYPYLLHAGRGKIRLTLIGGTNVAFAPSVDYVEQVLCPNFMRVGLPPVEVYLERRGWREGGLGVVRIDVDPLEAGRFPQIQMDHRGEIVQVDVTILAPDDVLGTGQTVRGFFETETFNALRSRLSIPVKLHTSERTYHRSHIYILLVGHTSTGFRIGRDILLGAQPSPGKKKHQKIKESTQSTIKHLVQVCVNEFMEEIFVPDESKPCVDVHMRDQLVIFEALAGQKSSDSQYWTLHTKTAQWVCDQILR